MLISIGDHIRKKRLQLGLFQRELAQQLGVNVWTILNWEKGYHRSIVAQLCGMSVEVINLEFALRWRCQQKKRKDFEPGI